jgi:hypothetical protein
VGAAGRGAWALGMGRGARTGGRMARGDVGGRQAAVPYVPRSASSFLLDLRIIYPGCRIGGKFPNRVAKGEAC